jgi:hypothetical protein
MEFVIGDKLGAGKTAISGMALHDKVCFFRRLDH